MKCIHARPSDDVFDIRGDGDVPPRIDSKIRLQSVEGRRIQANMIEQTSQNSIGYNHYRRADIQPVRRLLRAGAVPEKLEEVLEGVDVLRGQFGDCEIQILRHARKIERIEEFWRRDSGYLDVGQFQNTGKTPNRRAELVCVWSRSSLENMDPRLRHDRKVTDLAHPNAEFIRAHSRY